MGLVTFIYYFMGKQIELLMFQEDFFVWSPCVDALADVVHWVVARILAIEFWTFGSLNVAKFCAQLIVLALIQRDDLGGRTDLSFDVILLVHIISIGFILKKVDYRSLAWQTYLLCFLAMCRSKDCSCRSCRRTAQQGFWIASSVTWTQMSCGQVYY